MLFHEMKVKGKTSVFMTVSARKVGSPQKPSGALFQEAGNESPYPPTSQHRQTSKGTEEDRL